MNWDKNETTRKCKYLKNEKRKNDGKGKMETSNTVKTIYGCSFSGE